MIYGDPVKVNYIDPDLGTADKPGVVGIDVFSGRKVELAWFYAYDSYKSPIFNYKEYTLVSIDKDDEFVSLMDENGNLKEDLKLPFEEDVR